MPVDPPSTALHIAFVVANYPPHRGGVEQHVAALAAELVGRGHRVTVYVTESGPDRIEAGIPVVSLGRRLSFADIWSLPSVRPAVGLPGLLTAAATDVVSVHTRFFPATWLGIAAARRAQIPVILTEHGGGHVASDSALATRAALGFDVTLGRWAWRRSTTVLAVSQRAAQFVTDGCGREATVVGNGVDLPFWAGGSVTPQPQPQPQQQVLFVGRMVAEKGWRDFLAMLVRLPPPWRGVMAGDGPDAGAVAAEVARLGLHDRVLLAGHLDRTALRDLFASSVYVNPSTAAEGLQTTLLESAATGGRIVSYDVGGVAEVQQSGAAIRVVAPGDIEAIAEAVREVAALSQASAASLDPWTWPAVTDRYLRQFSTAVDAGER